MTNGPVLIDLNEPPRDVATAPPVPDAAPDLPQGRAVQGAAAILSRRPSRLTRWFWAAAAALIGAVVSVAAWDFVTDLLARWPLIGWAVTILVAVMLVLGLLIALREFLALGRLRRVDGLRREADRALADDDAAIARGVADRLVRFYRDRDALDWGRARLAERVPEQVDAVAILSLAEDELLAPLDQAALREAEAAARSVATVTALVPMALADVVAALLANLRMIRRIAEIYGGRSGLFASWRLTRAVLSHMVATGAIAVGDDLLEPVLGASILSKLSRRFGEGLVNGALTARVGVAAMEICRPLAFSELHRPKARGIVKRALAGLLTRNRD